MQEEIAVQEESDARCIGLDVMDEQNICCPKGCGENTSLYKLKLQVFDEVHFRIGCRSTHRQKCFIFHHLLAGALTWFEGRWYNNREVNYG